MRAKLIKIKSPIQGQYPEIYKKNYITQTYLFQTDTNDLLHANVNNVNKSIRLKKLCVGDYIYNFQILRDNIIDPNGPIFIELK
jgi:hypothetical protein